MKQEKLSYSMLVGMDMYDLWRTCRYDRVVCTTNACVNGRGQLVMGRGAAKEMADRWQGCAVDFGQLVLTKGERGDRWGRKLMRYGFLPHPIWPIGIFQVKWHWSETADLSLVEYSVEKLNEHIEETGEKVLMNYPGIGLGGLKYVDVRDVVSNLHPNVHLCVRSMDELGI